MGYEGDPSYEGLQVSQTNFVCALDLNQTQTKFVCETFITPSPTLDLINYINQPCLPNVFLMILTTRLSAR